LESTPHAGQKIRKVTENGASMGTNNSTGEREAGGRRREHWEALSRPELEHQVAMLQRAAGPPRWAESARITLRELVRELLGEWRDRKLYRRLRLRWTGRQPR
jgi:hypothetical protein